jgi:hypothetical protein
MHRRIAQDSQQRIASLRVAQLRHAIPAFDKPTAPPRRWIA